MDSALKNENGILLECAASGSLALQLKSAILVGQ